MKRTCGLLFLFFSFLTYAIPSYAQMAGYYTTPFNPTNNLDLSIDAKNHYSLELSSMYGDETKTHLLSVGTAKRIEDTIVLYDRINDEELKFVYTLERDRIKTLKGFDMMKGRYFSKTEMVVDDIYYNSVVLSTFELPKQGDATAIKGGTYYTSNKKKFCLLLQPTGKYMYSFDNLIISKGKWIQKKDEIELWDADCDALFTVKKLSAKELVVKSIFGIIKYYDPHTNEDAKIINHFFLQE